MAAVLNLILPQEDSKLENDEPVSEVEVIDIEGRGLADNKKQ